MARGFAVRRLRTLTTTGDPDARQRGMLGTASAIAFPQDACTILQTLPVSATDLCDYLSVFFTNENQSDLRFAKEYVVRRSVVHAALEWLIHHNPFYSDLQINMTALQELPIEGVPDAWTQAAQVASSPLTRNFGPVDATSVPVSDMPDPGIHAAVIEPSTDSGDPMYLWQTALSACERYDRHAQQEPDAAISDARLVQHVLHRLAASSNHNSFEQDAYHQQASTAPQAKLYAVLPHSDLPLDSYHPSFWAFCFPCLFPYGEGIDGQPRQTYLPDHDWASMLLRRRDRGFATHWRADLDFISVLFSVLHRRRLLRAVRIRIRSPTFRQHIPSLCSLRSTDWAHVATTVGESFHLHINFCFFLGGKETRNGLSSSYTFDILGFLPG